MKMGCEGGIYIISDEKLKEKWGEKGGILANQIPRHYCNEIDGKKYHHFYYGNNMIEYDPFELDSWDYEYAKKKCNIDKIELDEFVSWLKGNTKDWEVWT